MNRPKEETELLIRLAGEVTEGVIIEIGTYEGRSAISLCRGATVPVYTLDPRPEYLKYGPKDRAAFYHNMLKSDCKAIFIGLSSEVVTPGWRLPVGLLWIDGNHDFEAVLHDFTCWERHLMEFAKIAFDDSLMEGPKRVIASLIGQGYEVIETVGKITVMQ